MDQFNLITNKLINDIEKMSVSKQDLFQKPLENTLKTTRNIWRKQSYGANSIYSEVNVIKVPKEYNNLAQLYVKVTCGTGSVESAVLSEFATRIFSRITLRTEGTVTTLQYITPEYTQKRIYEISGTPLYTQITSGLDPFTAFVDGDVVVYVPLFFFFSEHYTNFLPTRELQPLEIEFITNVSKESMGMSADLTSINYELYACYHDNRKMTNNAVNELYNKFSLPKYLVNSYNMFEEDDVSVVAGATSAKLLLRCPYPSFSINSCLVDAESNRSQINTFKLTVGNTSFVDLDFRINYTMSGDNISNTEAGTFSYFFSILKSRMVDSGLITFSQEFFPCYLEVTFASSLVDRTLKVFEEVKSLHSIASNGDIGINTAVQKGEGFDQQNSYAGPFNLTGSG